MKTASSRKYFLWAGFFLLRQTLVGCVSPSGTTTYDGFTLLGVGEMKCDNISGTTSNWHASVVNSKCAEECATDDSW